MMEYKHSAAANGAEIHKYVFTGTTEHPPVDCNPLNGAT